MVRCSACGHDPLSGLVCPRCGAPQTVELDCFAALGLPRKLVVDPRDLESRYHELSRRLHPDRFASRDAKLRDASLKSTALLTRAYRTLREPVARGRYWLELQGEKLGDNNRVPPGLAAKVFEVQEELEELREARSAGARNVADLAAGLSKRGKEIEAQLLTELTSLEDDFRRWDESEALDRARLVVALKERLSSIAYLKTLVRDVERQLEDTAAA